MEIDRNLFDESVTITDRPRGSSEGIWPYLNRASGHDWGYLRSVLQGWFDSYDATLEQRNKLRSSFRRQKNNEHLSAFFELYLYTLLTSAGYHVLVEPELSGKNPDFLVRDEQGHSFILEATASYPKDSFDAQDSPAARLIDYLDEQFTASQLPRVNLRIEKLDHVTPSLSAIRDDIERWLSKLVQETDGLTSRHGDLAAETSNLTGVRQQSEWANRRGSWRFKLAVSHTRGEVDSPTRFVVGVSHAVRQVDRPKSIASAIKKKAEKYSGLEFPLIIAINDTEVGGDDRDVLDALFGIESLVVNSSGGHRNVRLTNGAWHVPRGFQKKSVSGVWIFDRVLPYRLNTQGTLWHHPAAYHPLPPDAFAFDQNLYDAISDSYIVQRGIAIKDCLKIDWTQMPR